MHSEPAITLNYEPRGFARLHQTPKGFATNYYHQIIGSGHQEFLDAKRILSSIDHLNWEWVDCMSDHNDLCIGTTLATQVRYLNLWALDISQVTEIIDEENDKEIRFGYVMGSTQVHVLHGEESFTIIYDKQTEDIHYHIYSYSKPKGPFFTLGLPFIRQAQRKFVRAATQYLSEQLCKQQT